MNIHKHMAERMQLAATYAKDGAFHSSAEILDELAADVKAHAEDCSDFLEQMIRSTPSNPQALEQGK